MPYAPARPGHPAVGFRLIRSCSEHSSYQQIALTPGGELTANVYPAPNPSDPLNVLVMTTETGGVAVTTDTFAGRKPYRCVVDPLN